MGRLLFITSTRIGDAILSSGLVAHWARTRPDLAVTVAAGPLAAPLFRAAPNVVETIVMTKRKSGGHWLDLWRRVVGRSWDAVVDLRGSRTAWFLRAKRRTLAGPPRDDVHKVVAAGALLGLDPPPEPTIVLDDRARADAAAALAGLDRFIVTAPAASSRYKEWPYYRFAELARRLTAPGAALAGAGVVVLGGPGDGAAIAAASAGLDPARTRALVGALDIVAAGALIERAALFVGDDSGLMHLSAAVGAPTLGLFGPTDDRVYGPWGARTAVARHGPRPDPSLRRTADRENADMLNGLDVETVEAAALDVLRRSAAHA